MVLSALKYSPDLVLYFDNCGKIRECSFSVADHLGFQVGDIEGLNILELVQKDNLINQKLVVRILNKLGYQIDIANNGVEAVAICKEKFYDLIFMDVLMPDMDGLEATRIIRTMEITQPKIIAMTANASSEDRDACLQAGMDSFTTKPIKLEELMKLLTEVGEPTT